MPNKKIYLQKSDKLPLDIIAEAHKALNHYHAIQEKITDRMNYIIHFCVESIGGQLEWWDWPNSGGEGSSAGDFQYAHSGSETELSISGEWDCWDRMLYIDKFGSECSVSDGIPIRWLHEDFEDEYTKGIQLYTDKQALKIKDKNSKKELRKKIEAAKAKLTPEELKALKIK